MGERDAANNCCAEREDKCEMYMGAHGPRFNGTYCKCLNPSVDTVQCSDHTSTFDFRCDNVCYSIHVPGDNHLPKRSPGGPATHVRKRMCGEVSCSPPHPIRFDPGILTPVPCKSSTAVQRTAELCVTRPGLGVKGAHAQHTASR